MPYFEPYMPSSPRSSPPSSSFIKLGSFLQSFPNPFRTSEPKNIIDVNTLRGLINPFRRGTVTTPRIAIFSTLDDFSDINEDYDYQFVEDNSDGESDKVWYEQDPYSEDIRAVTCRGMEARRKSWNEMAAWRLGY